MTATALNVGELTLEEAVDESFAEMPATVRRRLGRSFRLPDDATADEAAKLSGCSISTLERDLRLWRRSLVSVYSRRGYTLRNIAVTLGLSVEEVRRIHDGNTPSRLNTGSNPPA
jgi:hypothetical protein